MHYLLDVVNLHQMTRSWKLNGLKLLLRDPILDPVFLLQGLLLLWSELSLLVDKEPKLSDALLLLVFLCNPINVDVQSHKLS